MEKPIIILIATAVVAVLALIIGFTVEKKGNRKHIRLTKGQVGEYYAFRNLQAVPGNKGMLSNVYIPKLNGQMTEIDCIMIHQKGLFVIESKNRAGHIFGSPDDQNWTQVLRRGIHNTFYNPVKQNDGHVKFLKEYISRNTQGKYGNIPVYSVIAFGPNADILNVKLNGLQFKNTFIVNTEHIAITVTNIVNSIQQDCFSPENVAELYNLLSPLINVTEEQKLQHIENIKNYKK